MGRTSSARNTKTRSRQRASSPWGPRGAALELRSLLPNLTASVTKTRPCVRCGGATPTRTRKHCTSCIPIKKKEISDGE